MAVDSLVEAALGWNERRIDRLVPKGSGPFDPVLHPWTATIEQSYGVVRGEVDALVEQRISLPAVGDVYGDQGQSGRWSTFVLHSYGRWVDANVVRAPRTAQLVADVPGLLVAGFTVLAPGTHIPRHRGPSRGTLRYHLGIRCPDPVGAARLQVGDVMHLWADGASVMFDDSVQHEAWNDGGTDRFVLFIETLWPLPGTVGLTNRLTQRGLGLATRALPDRIAALDQALNG